MAFFNRLISAEIKNFCSIKNISLTVENQRLTHIIGINNDDDLSPSNGSGKSTIKSAVCWNLFGMTETGRQADSVLPWLAPKNCEVKTVWKNGPDELTICRYRAHKEKKNLVELFLNGEDITGKDNDDTQSLINNYLGFNYDLFCLLLTTGMTSKKLKDFMVMSDKEKKEFVGFLLDLSFLDNAQSTCKERLKVAEAGLASSTSTLNDKESKLTFAHEKLADSERKVENYAKQVEEQIASKQVTIDGLERDLTAQRKPLEALRDQIKAVVIPDPPDTSKIDQKRKDIKGYLTHNEEQQAQKSKLGKELLELTQKLGQPIIVDENSSELSKKRGEIVAAERELSVKESFSTENYTDKSIESFLKKISDEEYRLSTTKTELTKFQKELAALAKICPTCGQALAQEHIAKIELDLTAKIQNCTETVAQLSESITSRKLTLCDYRIKKVAEIKSENASKIDDLKAEIAQLKEIYASAKQQEFERLTKERNLETIKAKIASIESEIKTCDALITTNLKYADKLESEVLLEESEIRDLQAAVLQKTQEKASLRSQFEAQKSSYTALKTRIDAEKVAIENLKSERTTNPYTQFVASAKADISKLESEKQTVAQVIAEQQETVNYLEFWAVGFGDKGVKSYILDSVTELLEQKANFALSYITNGNVSIGFCTQKKNKSSDVLRDELTVEIFRDGQCVQFVDLSKGERCRVSFAVNYALKALGTYYHGLHLNFEWYDEVLDGLDEIGCYQVIQFLRKELSNYESIFVVSHNPNVTSLFDKSLAVVKTNGISEMSSQ